MGIDLTIPDFIESEKFMLAHIFQIASKIKPESGPSTTPSLTAGVKRPLEDSFALGKQL